MITLFLFVAIFSALSYYFSRSPFGGKDPIAGAMGGIVGFFIGFLVSFVILPDIYGSKSDFIRSKSETKLVSLSGKTSLAGEFFLGTGNFEGEKRYYYMASAEKGIYSRSVSAGDAYIVETDSTAPKIVHHRFESKICLWYLPSKKTVEAAENYHQIYIPTGSVKRRYIPN